MVQVVCQRCGASNEHERLNIAHFKLKHEKGCGSGIGIVKVATVRPAEGIQTGTETATTNVMMTDSSSTVETTTESTEDPTPKKSKRKKKSE